jgi:TrmH family RNA methyltransferase
LIAAGTCVDVFDPKVVRATAGSIFHMPVLADAEADQMLGWARESGICTVAACLEGARPHTEIRYRPRMLVMVGNEANGLRPEVARRADLRAYIPMPGRAESLNVTVAAGILIWEILRQRQ